MEPINATTKNEINKDIVTPSDFTVMMTQKPHTDVVGDLEGIYWAWAENVNNRESIEMVNPITGEIDPYQNYVFNVTTALNNVGYLNYWKDMGVLLQKKKKHDK